MMDAISQGITGPFAARNANLLCIPSAPSRVMTRQKANAAKSKPQMRMAKPKQEMMRVRPGQKKATFLKEKRSNVSICWE